MDAEEREIIERSTDAGNRGDRPQAPARGHRAGQREFHIDGRRLPARGLAGRDRRRAEGQRPRAAGLQDRQDRPPGCWPSGALSQPVGELSPIAHSNARFALTAVGPTPTPESISVVRAYLAYLAQAIRPHVTGTTYVNFLDLDGATPERVRAAYSSDDWARLVQLKYRYDPHNVFRFNRNVPPGGHGPVLPR